jgi:hypothetical protein
MCVSTFFTCAILLLLRQINYSWLVIIYLHNMFTTLHTYTPPLEPINLSISRLFTNGIHVRSHFLAPAVHGAYVV